MDKHANLRAESHVAPRSGRPITAKMAPRLVVVGFVLLFVSITGCSKSGDATHTGGSEDQFFAALEGDSTFAGLDSTAVSDVTLSEAGHAFCAHLDAIGAAAKFEDFDPTAQVIAGKYLQDFRLLDKANPLGTPYGQEQKGNAPLVAAYSVGTAAVKTLCPSHAQTLG